MKSSSKRVLAAAALLAAAVCASGVSAQRGGEAADREGRRYFRLGDLISFDGFDMETRGGEVVGMTVMRKDGSWLPLKQQTTPTYATNCPPVQKMVCWEDEKQLMSICVCVDRNARPSNFRLQLGGHEGAGL